MYRYNKAVWRNSYRFTFNSKFIILITLFGLLLIANLNAACNSVCRTKKYYTSLHQAEAAILKDDFSSATKLYKKTFLYIKHPFSNDLLVASICMLKTKITDINLLNRWSKLYQYQTGESLENKLKDSDLYKGTTYHQLLSKEEWFVVSKDTIALSGYALNKRISLEKIWQKDQDIRHKMDEEYGVQKYWIPEARKQIMYVDSINLVAIDSILNDEEFSEFELGNDGVGIIFLVLLHNSQWQTDQVYSVAEKNRKNVKIGKIDNRKFAQSFDRFCDNADELNPKINCIQGHFYGELIYWIYNDYHTYPNFSITDTEKINQNRKEIYLTSIEERIKQLRYQVKKENLFFINTSMWSELSEYQSDEIKKSIDAGDLILIK